MKKTIEEKLAQASAFAADLTSQLDAVKATVAERDATIADLSAKLAALEPEAAEAAQAKAALAEAAAKIAALEADAKSAEARAADIIAAANISDPVAIAPGSQGGTKSSREELLHAYHAERDPRKKAELFLKLNPAR